MHTIGCSKYRPKDHFEYIHNIYGPAHVFVSYHIYAYIPLINAATDVYSVAKGLNLGLSLYLHPYFVYVSREGSGESVHMRRTQTGLSLCC